MEGKTPPGISAISKACSAAYPDQPNPLQVAALVKYWLGGPDPLDFISIYRNKGSKGTPPHWHYISYGLSDLYGDGRIHTVAGEKSGFGFELTFRVISDDSATPPTWPAELLQSIARYVFSCESVLCVGDHISWHSALDGGDSRIQHLLLAEDPQLSPVTTPHGTLTFIQLVGVISEELSSAQWWNCLGVLSLLSQHTMTGGPLLVTDMRRGETVFDVDPSAKDQVDEGVAREGSLLSGVNALCSWDDGSRTNHHSDPELTVPRPLEKVKVQLNKEALSLLPLAIRGRLRHNRHFTYKSFTEDLAVTLVASGVEGSFTTDRSPLAAHGHWLQVYLNEDHLQQLEVGVAKLLAKESSSTYFELKQLHMTLGILPDKV